MGERKIMSSIEGVIEKVKRRDPYEFEFHQAVEGVFGSLRAVAKRHPEFLKAKIYDRIVEPDRVIMFTVPWVDDRGEVRINRGFRVQFSNMIGPYKGGLRFHPSVNLGVLKCLGFEQTFKNSLTALPMGGAKGGSDFDPKGKSDMEVMRFCQAFIRELLCHVDADMEVLTGGLGVGDREIDYMYGYCRKLRAGNAGFLTGKALSNGGSPIRQKATGYGCVYFAAEMLATRGLDFKDKTVAVSGSGKVAQCAVEKVNELGGKVISLCDSSSTIIDEEGIDSEKCAYVMDLKNIKRGRLSEYADTYPGAECFVGENIWDVIRSEGIKVDVALPCATQNEIEGAHAEALMKNGCVCIAEGANMPSTPEAVRIYQEYYALYGPGKAANAGGAAMSGLEMSRNGMRPSWSRQEADARLRHIMKGIHKTCLQASEAYGKKGDYATGANIAGFLKVADAMLTSGVV